MLTAIVTGVSRGLGEALAAQLLERGCRVVGIGRGTSARLAGERYTFVKCDLGDAAALAERAAPAFARIAAERPDAICLINNAATLEPVGVLGTLGSVDIARSITVNLVAPIGLSSLFCKTFDDGAMDRRIINVSSGAAQSTLPGESLYCIAKAGLEMLTRSLAAVHASTSFRAITLRPGIIDTDMQVAARGASEADLPSVGMFRSFKSENQLKTPDEVAAKIIALEREGRLPAGVADIRELN